MSQKFNVTRARDLFENAQTHDDYLRAKQHLRHASKSQVFELVDSMIDARLRLEVLRIAREGL